jgi:hypothetical protein
LHYGKIGTIGLSCSVALMTILPLENDEKKKLTVGKINYFKSESQHKEGAQNKHDFVTPKGQ